MSSTLINIRLLYCVHKNLIKKTFVEHNNLQKNAKEVILNLKQNHKLFILTSRWTGLKEGTILWLEKHFGENFFEDIIFIGDNKTEIKLCKSDVCQKYNFDLLIEDVPHFAENTAKKGIKVLLYNCPWNLSLKKNKNLIRVNNWKEIEKVLS